MPISPPVQITVPFATSGLKNTIPANTNNITGNAGYDAGFGAINMTPKTAGGIPPFGQDFNGIFFDVTTAIRFLEAGGSFPYSSAFSTAVGGYPLGAIVSRTDGTGLWRNTIANNTTDPETFGAGWQPEDAGSAAITMTNANVTLTALQAARSIIIITGALTANLNLILPGYAKQWLIINNCTGAFVVTVKTASGSGVSTAPGSTQLVYGDLTNINSSGSGRLLNIQTFNTPGSFTYTPTAGATSAVVEVQAGGGGGGGAAATAAGAFSLGSGGGAGGYSKTRIAYGLTSTSVTVGAGGTGGNSAAGPGGNGGSSSFGAFASATGGGAATATGASTGVPVQLNGAAGGLGSLGNLINSSGQGGGGYLATAVTNTLSGFGGASNFSGGGAARIANNSGIAGLYGSGGSGANSQANPGGGFNGGAGGAGIIIVWEYS